MISADRAEQVFQRAGRQRVIVLGDMVLDDHIVGSTNAMAREAPVPVVEMQTHYAVPGGGTNVAANLRALGCDVCVAGVVGNDAAGRCLRVQLEERAIKTAGLVVDGSRQTSVKLRIWVEEESRVHPRMMARVDTVERHDLTGASASALVTYLEQELPETSLLLISDYENGVMAPNVLNAALCLARANHVRVAVDAHGRLARFKGALVVTPNQPEAEAELGRKLDSNKAIRAAATDLRERLSAEGIVITLGAAGMVVAGGGEIPLIIPARPQTKVADATGAGDTVAAAVTVGLLGGASFVEAALLSELAARVVVRRLGVAVPSIDEILIEAGRDS